MQNEKDIFVTSDIYHNPKAMEVLVKRFNTFACFHGLEFYTYSRGNGTTLYVKFVDPKTEAPFDLSSIKDLADWFLAGWHAAR